MPAKAPRTQLDNEINRGYLAHFRRWSGQRTGKGLGSFSWRVLYGRPARLVTLPLLPLVILWVLIRLKLTRSTPVPVGDLHRRASDYVDNFVEQYPLHLYPILAKAFEQAYLKEALSDVLAGNGKVLEVAVGDGTLSKHLFGPGQSITALDLNPYSLSKALRLPHVGRAVIADGLNPPFSQGAFDLLLSNNFLHHVTQKRSTLGNWSKLASTLVFNENTPYWASGWTAPYILRQLGLERLSRRSASAFERNSLQSLESMKTLTEYAQSVSEVRDRTSFISERTFFYCSLFSFALRCTGPPTPSLWKTVALGPLRSVVLPLTRTLARMLIEFDAYQDRSTDTFVAFRCRTAQRRESRTTELICPLCSGEVVELRCQRCGEQFPQKDGMIFVLPPHLRGVFQDYRSEIAAATASEHL